MAHIYYSKDAVVIKRSIENSNLIEEYIGVQPDKVIVLDGSSDFTSSIIAVSAATASYAPNYILKSTAIAMSIAL